MARNSNEWYSIDEIYQLLKSIDRVKLLELARYVRIWEGNLHSAQRIDLVQEVIKRLLNPDETSRKWPRDMPMTTYFRHAAGSVADQWSRISEKGTHVAKNMSLETETIPTNQLGAASAIQRYQHAKTLLPDEAYEQEQLKSNQYALMLKHFENDEETLDIIQWIAEGISPSEIQATLGLSRTQYNSARRKIRRYINSVNTSGVKNG